MGVGRRYLLALSAAFLFSPVPLCRAAVAPGIQHGRTGFDSAGYRMAPPRRSRSITTATARSPRSFPRRCPGSAPRWRGACLLHTPRQCITLQLALNTSALLPAGMTTGIVTVADNDANVVDAPQTITVTVAIGGTVRASLDLYVAPGSTRDINFVTNSPINGRPKLTTADSGSHWRSTGRAVFNSSAPSGCASRRPARRRPGHIAALDPPAVRRSRRITSLFR